MSSNLDLLKQFLPRVTRWQEGLPDLHDAKSALDALADELEWVDKGLAEYRAEASSLRTQAEAARATARIAIRHLHAVLNQCRTHAEQQADEAARDWLISIGSEANHER